MYIMRRGKNETRNGTPNLDVTETTGVSKS